MTPFLSLMVHVSIEMKWCLPWNWRVVGSFSVTYILFRYQFTKFSLPS
jgi:hypothetical protein